MKYINMEEFPRKEHFKLFNGMANPYVGVTVDVDITDFLKKCKEKKYNFFLSFLYCVGQSANAVPEFRQRISDGAVVEYEKCDTSHTVMLENGTYCYCRLDCVKPFEEYLPQAVNIQEEAKRNNSIDDGDDGISLIYISTAPWFKYTALVQPTPVPADSNPRITWGRYEEKDGKITMPVSVLANHALVDGVHIARFYDGLNAWLKKTAKI